MKKNIYLLTVLVFITACSTQGKRAEFKTGKPVQVLEFHADHHLYAQNDVILERNHLDKQLASLNENFNKNIDKAQLYDNLSLTAYVLQLISMAACFGQNETRDIYAWCGGSLVMGLGFAIPFNERANFYRHKVVTDYNQTFMQ